MMDGSGSVTLLLLLLWMFEVSRQWKEDRRKEVNPLIYLALAQSLDLLYLQKKTIPCLDLYHYFVRSLDLLLLHFQKCNPLIWE